MRKNIFFSKKKLLILSIISMFILSGMNVIGVGGQNFEIQEELKVNSEKVDSIDELLSNTKDYEPGNNYRYSFCNENGLMIESGYIFRSDWNTNTYISFDLDFPGTPVVVTNGHDSDPLSTSPTDISSSGFNIRVQYGSIGYTQGTISWIAVYPHEYEDPNSDLMIEAGQEYRANWNSNDQINYNLDFPGTPYVITNAHKGTNVYLSCAGYLSSNGFKMHIKNYFGLWQGNAEAFWIAIWPHEYEDPYSNLIIESDSTYRTNWITNEDVYFDLDFPDTPVVVTNAQKNEISIFVSSQNSVNKDKFILWILNYLILWVNTAKVLWIAIYPDEWESNNPPNTPTRPNGPDELLVGEEGEFCTSATEPDDQDVRYRFDWDAEGSHDYSEWTEYVPAGTIACLDHSWDSPGTYIVKAQAQDIYEMPSEWSTGLEVTVRYNQPPGKPSIPNGPTSGATNVEYTYSSISNDPEGDQIYYKFDWGDGINSGWIGPYGSGQTGKASHSWCDEGIYNITVKTKDVHNDESAWSNPLQIEIFDGIAILEIIEIKGGKGVSAVIRNSGAIAASNINCAFSVKGLIFGKIDDSQDFAIPLLDPNDQTTISFNNPTMGIDIVDITVEVTAPEVDPVSKSARGIQLLYWIFLFPEE